MTDSNSADGLALSASQLQYKLALVLCLGQEDGERLAGKGASPVREAGISREGQRLEEVVEVLERDV